MTSLREFILQQSSLPTGNLIRDHVNNPGEGTGSIDYIILADGLGVGMENETVMAEIDQECVGVTIDNSHIGVGVDDQDILAEVTNGNI